MTQIPMASSKTEKRKQREEKLERFSRPKGQKLKRTG
jgi:hypothetical protein